MNKISLNPFNSLYQTESIAADAFVDLFSPVLLKESIVQRLFEPGNVVLCGLQGSGKSALLNILEPDVLIEFLKSDREWPLPEHCSKFISASTTLRSSGALLFGQREIEGVTLENEKVIGLYFADFLNYSILLDLVKKIQLLSSKKGAQLSKKVGLKTEKNLLDKFAKKLSSEKCWLGSLTNINTFDELLEALECRIQKYNSFLNYNSEFPSEFLRTKTIAGEPIAIAADCLRSCGILPKSIPLFVTIDQFEDLMDLEREVSEKDRPIFRSVIMKMLGNRDDRVSYRIGARLYSLDKGIRGLSGNALVEEMREVNVINLDDLLQGRENRKSLFPEFCNDVLCRRLIEAGYSEPKNNVSTLVNIFGKRVSPEQKVETFITKSRARVISTNFHENKEIIEILKGIAETDPIAAKMGEAWVRQNSKKLAITSNVVHSMPWSKRQWWKKERKQQAMLQVFAACGQKMVWYGSGDVVNLSGRNILTFLSICQFVWAELLRSLDEGPVSLPKSISPLIQTLGINSASEYWFRKIKAEPKGGDDRNRFANELGNVFRKKLRNDQQMSYPGQNGFSLSVNAVVEEQVLENFLSDCVAFGVLESRPHTPKTSSRGQSEKWYLSPILSPHFQIPTAHTKEPYYATTTEVLGWMKKAKIVSVRINREEKSTNAKTKKASDDLQLKFLLGD